MSRLLTTDQAATLVGVRSGTLREYARDGHAPQPQRFGRALMWDEDEIRAWLDQRPGQGARTDLRRG